jgi:hypothetical protein
MSHQQEFMELPISPHLENAILGSGIQYVLRKFDGLPCHIAGVVVWPSQGKSGLLDEKGQWMKEFWTRIQESIPEIHGIHLFWNALIVVIPSKGEETPEAILKAIIHTIQQPELVCFCVLTKASSSVDKMKKLNELEECLLDTFPITAEFITLR